VLLVSLAIALLFQNNIARNAEEPVTFDSKKKGYITDRDGNTYDTIHYKGYAIMVESLRTTTFANGDEIERIKSDEDWKENNKTQKAGYCYYDNSKAYAKKYGLMYTPYTVYDKRGIAPEGWYIPTSKEWKKIIGGYSNKSPNSSINCELYTKWMEDNMYNPKPSESQLLSQKLNFRGYGFRDYKGNFKGEQVHEGKAAYIFTSDHKYMEVGWLATKFKDHKHENTTSGNLGAYIRCVKKLN